MIKEIFMYALVGAALISAGVLLGIVGILVTLGPLWLGTTYSLLWLFLYTPHIVLFLAAIGEIEFKEDF